MDRKNLTPLCVLLLSLAAAGTAFADNLHLSVAKTDTPVINAFSVLAKEAGATILADSSVTETIGETEISKPDLESMMNAIVSLVPGIQWMRVYLPQDATVPGADVLSRQVSTLKNIPESDILVSAPASHSGFTFGKKSDDSPDTTPDGMKVIYLVTAAKVPHVADQGGAAAPNVTPADLTALGNAMKSMTPQQQQAWTASLSQVLQGMDPMARQQVIMMSGGGGGSGIVLPPGFVGGRFPGMPAR